MSDLYLDCSSGISGDMFCGAMLDLGADAEKLGRVLNSLGVDGFSYEITRRNAHGLDACDFNVMLHHGHAHGDAHIHEHRNLADVTRIIDSGDMDEKVRTLAKKIFSIVAHAEAKVHGKPVGEVHFHEVGAVDSIVDIVSAAFCTVDLGIERTFISPISEGRGFVKCQHGLLPVPVPATAEIAAEYALPLSFRDDIEGELATPTGAAIAAALRCGEKMPETFIVRKTGLGAGKRDYGIPNVVRAMLIEPEKSPDTEGKVCVIESNIDDSTGEMLGFAMERLMAAGALDAHYTPCFMKKNRPAYLLRAICRPEDSAKMEEIIFSSTSTIGVRRTLMERTCLPRDTVRAELPFGTVVVKKCPVNGRISCHPEYESVKEVSDRSGVPFESVYAAAKAKAEGLL